MNYAAIKYCDIANGPGVRTSLFVSGCRHHCPDCFNEVAWDFDYGQPFTPQVADEIIRSMNPFVAGLSLLGGEPMEPENQPALLAFLLEFRRACPDKSVWCYSGFTLEQLTGGQARCCTEVTRALLGEVDVLVDGPYLAAERDPALRFRGSANQRVLNLPESLSAGEPVWWTDDPLFAEHEKRAVRGGREADHGDHHR